MKGKQGFTVIELMIVLVIVSILLALAYPSYVKYVRKGKRGEAQQALMNWAVNQEIWRSNNPAYAAAADLPVPNTEHYGFTISAVSATTYILRAEALADQKADKARNNESCEFLYLNQNGQKYNAAGDTTKSACWE
jgi:type IV pilus assembly protein PilE